MVPAIRYGHFRGFVKYHQDVVSCHGVIDYSFISHFGSWIGSGGISVADPKNHLFGWVRGENGIAPGLWI